MGFYESCIRRLAKRLANRPHDSKDQNPDEQKLKDAIETVADAKNELFDVEDAAALESLVKGETLRQAYNTIARLGSKDPGPAEGKDAEPSTQRVTAEVQATRVEAGPDQVSSLEQPTYSVGAWAVAARPVPDAPQPANTVRVRTGRPFRSAALWLGLGLAGLIAVLTILVTDIYPDPGEAFGTTKDYLAVFIAASTGAVAAQFLQGPLATFLTRWRGGG